MYVMELFVVAFITLLVIVDPLGNAAVFSGLSAKMKPKDARATAIRATLIAIAVLLFFGFVGKFILTYMGISNEAFKIAGGLLLFYTAFKMVLGGHEQSAPDVEDHKNIAIFPMAIPLMAGPGCATAFIILLDEAKAENITAVTYVVAAMFIVEIITLFCLFTATQIKRIMGEGALSIVARVMGIFLAALSVQLILDGIRAV